VGALLRNWHLQAASAAKRVLVVMFAALVWTAAAGGALAQPVVTALSQTRASFYGEAVTITGSGFTGATSVMFGSQAATNVNVANDNTITVTTPANPVWQSVVNVLVTTPAGTSAGGPTFAFDVHGAQPGVYSISSSSGPEAGGETIIITGNALLYPTAVQFGGVQGGGGIHSGGGVLSPHIVGLTATTIQAVVPPGTGTVDIFVYGPSEYTNCRCGGPDPNDPNERLPPATYTYIPTPATSGISPGNGPGEGGTVVTLTGTGFSGATAVSFGATPATTFTINSDTSITATSPAGTGTVSVTVTAPGGTSGGYAFRYAHTDSLKVEVIQEQATTAVAGNSGRSVTGAIASGIAQGFAGGPTANVGLAAESAFMAYAPEAAANGAFEGFDRPGFISPADQWNLWLDVQGSGLLSGGSGQQLNITGGAGYRVTEDFIAGIIGGQESFSYSSAGLNGLLSGSGLSAGGYVAWRFSDHGMFDAAVVGTALGYKVTSGTANGVFNASRWLITSGVTGDFALGENLTVSPSARIFGLWENQLGWTDNLAAPHAARSFSNGTASGGATFSGKWLLLDDMTLLPYFGLFADYRFDNSGGTTTSGLEGRVRAGVKLNVSASAAINIGGELGGLFSQQRTWSLNAGVSGGF
jgi:spore coat protein U-like protein